MKKYSFAIVGASGMVGQNFLKVLAEKDLPIDKVYLFASARSAGKTAEFKGLTLTIEELTPQVFERNIDFALFGVDGPVSLEYAPIAARNGCIVIDNSSAWRMDSSVPLVVPEVNADDISWHKGIIANPNCCVVPAVVALNPLHKKYGIKRVIYSTYQSVSGSGVNGMDDLERTLKGEAPQFYPYPIAGNVIPHIDKFDEDGYTGEETKVIMETRKILHAPDIKVTATCVRVPVWVGHSLSLNVEFEEAFDVDEVRRVLEDSPGIVLRDDPRNNVYPVPRLAEGTDTVYVGRIRRDFSADNSLNLWAVADNTRKGAASNAVQIAETVIKSNIWQKV